MYTLRIVFNNKVELNKYIGCQYTVIWKSLSPDDFDSAYKDAFESDIKRTDVNGFVVFNGDEFWPIYNDNEYYIMTDSGKTFTRL